MESDTPNTAHKKGRRPKRKQSPAFTDAQIAEAVERWVNGEFLKDIAPSYGVSPSQLQAYTKFARIGKTSTAKKPKLLSDAQIADAAERWLNGERLKDIALTYGISISPLLKYIKIAHGGKKRRLLTDEQIADAVERWANGEFLKNIALSYGISTERLSAYTKLARKNKKRIRKKQAEKKPIGKRHRSLTDAQTYGISTDRLQDDTKEARKEKKRISQPLSISEQQISAAIVQWELGVPTKAIAAEYGVSHKHLAEKLILCCAKRGWRIKEIVKSFRKSHSEIRGIILRNAPVQ